VIDLHPTLGFLDAFSNAVDFIFNEQTSRFSSDPVGGPDQVLELLGDHIKVSFLALGAALLLALPTGLLLGHYGRGELFAVGLGNAGRAVPELALIAFVAAFIGVGLLNVTLALAVLGVPPILTNSYVGVRQVDRSTVDAARGMGMNTAQILARIELPLAVPTIMSGVRTGAIAIIATATIAPLAGGLSLGDFNLSRNVYGDEGVLAGAILVALLAVTVELLLAGLQRLLTPRGIKLARRPAAA
jgi:osmoprotectant transport system permease protein